MNLQFAYYAFKDIIDVIFVPIQCNYQTHYIGTVGFHLNYFCFEKLREFFYIECYACYPEKQLLLLIKH